MNFALPWPCTTPIGVDLAGRWIKLAQAVVGPGATRRINVLARAVRPCEPARSAPLTPDDAALVAGIIERAGFRGTSVVLGVPRDLLAAAYLELPPRVSGASIEEIARVELARTHKLEPEKLEISMWDIPPPARSQPGTHVIAAALIPGAIDPFLDALDAQGVEVIAIDMRQAAIARTASTLSTPDGMTCVIDANWNGLSVVFALTGVVVVERFVDHVNWARVCIEGAKRAGCSPHAVHEAMTNPSTSDNAPLASACRALATEYYESLAPEVIRSVSYATHRYPATPARTVLLSGDAARAPGLAERLGNSLSLPVRILSPRFVAGAPANSDHCSDDPCYAAALGLALHACPIHARRAA